MIQKEFGLMFKYILPLFFVIFLSLNSLGLKAQDSMSTSIVNPEISNQQVSESEQIPEPSTETPNQPTTIEYRTETNSQQQVNTPIIEERRLVTPVIEEKPQRINQAPDDTELKAARKNNPFGLIRNGQPRPSKSISMFPTGSKGSTTIQQEIEETEETQQEAIVIETFEPIDTSIIALNNNNPFRLEGSKDDRTQIAKATKIKFNPNAGSGVKNTKEKPNPLFDTSKVDVNQDSTLKFTFLTILLGLLAFIVTSFRTELTDVYHAFLSQNLMALLHRDKETILRFPYLIIYLLSAISIGTSIFLISNLLQIQIVESQTYSILLCIAGVGAFFIFKHFILSVLSALFPFKKEINLYSFTIATFNFIIGIALLPFISLLAFSDSALHNYILNIMLALIVIILIYRIFRSLLIGQKYLINNKFHFFMYLCTVEIAPMIILFKFLS